MIPVWSLIPVCLVVGILTYYLAAMQVMKRLAEKRPEDQASIFAGYCIGAGLCLQDALDIIDDVVRARYRQIKRETLPKYDNTDDGSG